MTATPMPFSQFHITVALGNGVAFEFSGTVRSHHDAVLRMIDALLYDGLASAGYSVTTTLTPAVAYPPPEAPPLEAPPTATPRHRGAHRAR